MRRNSWYWHGTALCRTTCLLAFHHPALRFQESPKRVEHVMSKCWKVWQGGREPPAEQEKAFKRLREKVRHAELRVRNHETRMPGKSSTGREQGLGRAACIYIGENTESVERKSRRDTDDRINRGLQARRDRKDWEIAELDLKDKTVRVKNAWKCVGNLKSTFEVSRMKTYLPGSGGHFFKSETGFSGRRLGFARKGRIYQQ